LDEHKLIRERERGEKAKRLLENELLVEAWTNIEEKLMVEWRATGPDEMPRREDCWRTLRLLNKLESVFKTHIERGEIAVKMIATVEEDAKRKRFHVV
jgi:hypothetical protein|tara:strand:- start:644 stop:937 length:294 start_codon:yes stop_codon:yes gene_type:complete